VHYLLFLSSSNVLGTGITRPARKHSRDRET
jgi:hypothetical protein